MSSYEPTSSEVRLTLWIGGTVGSPVYRRYVDGLDLSGNESVLDFGAGSGVCSKHLAARLQKNGGHLTCLDVSKTWNPVIQRTLRRYSNVDYLLGDIEAVGIPDESFDAIMSHFVIHDIPAEERGSIVEQWARVLRAGGKVFLREPIGPKGMPADELDRLMQGSGFEAVASRVTNVPMMGRTVEATYIK